MGPNLLKIICMSVAKPRGVLVVIISYGVYEEDMLSSRMLKLVLRNFWDLEIIPNDIHLEYIMVDRISLGA